MAFSVPAAVANSRRVESCEDMANDLAPGGDGRKRPYPPAPEKNGPNQPSRPERPPPKLGGSSPPFASSASCSPAGRAGFCGFFMKRTRRTCRNRSLAGELVAQRLLLGLALHRIAGLRALLLALALPFLPPPTAGLRNRGCRPWPCLLMRFIIFAACSNRCSSPLTAETVTPEP